MDVFWFFIFLIGKKWDRLEESLPRKDSGRPFLFSSFKVVFPRVKNRGKGTERTLRKRERWRISAAARVLVMPLHWKPCLVPGNLFFMSLASILVSSSSSSLMGSQFHLFSFSFFLIKEILFAMILQKFCLMLRIFFCFSLRLSVLKS